MFFVYCQVCLLHPGALLHHGAGDRGVLHSWKHRVQVWEGWLEDCTVLYCIVLYCTALYCVKVWEGGMAGGPAISQRGESLSWMWQLCV